MANRQTTFLIKRSNVPGKIPPASGLTSGELALNTADAILYTSGSTANSILPIGWDRIYRTGDTVNGDFNFFGDIQISGSSLPSGYALSVTGDTNLNGDVYVLGDLFYSGSVVITGSTVIEDGLTANTIYTDYIDFNTGATVTQSQGRISWDSGTGTLNIAVGDGDTGLIDLQVGQEEIVRVFNSEATTLQKGEIVYVSGSQGNRPSVKRASAVSDGYSVTTLGMVDLAIPSGSEGYVTTFGIISNLNTLGLTGGTPIWLSPTTPGAYTSTKPIAPEHTVLIGYVVRVDATTGSIFVNISNGWELDEIHDVRISGATEGDLLVRSSYSGTPVWVNSKTLNGNYTISGNTSQIGNFNITGNTVVNGDLYANNLFSGNTNLLDIFVTSGQMSGTSVSAGSNISVQMTTATNYEVSVVDYPIFSGISANTISILNTPTLNNNLTQILGRNETTGNVEYRQVNTIGNNYTYVSGATYSALTTDNVIGVDSSISATTIYLPNSVTSGRLRYDVKDIGLNSYVNNITFIANGSDTIISTENSNNVVLATDGGALIIFNTGTGIWLQM